MTNKSSREKVLDKLRKMYAHARSAEAIGSEEEASAFAAKVQEMLSRHKISLSEVEQQEQDEVDPVGRRLVDFRSAGIKIRRHRCAWQEALASIVVRAYFCKMIVITGSSQLYFCGRGTDLEAAEQVFLYLVRVAGNLSDVAYVKYFYECRAAGDVGAARGFRASYLSGFTNRLAKRYDEEREKIRAEYADVGNALVRLTDAVSIVEAYIAKRGDTKRAAVIGMMTGEENFEGWLRGERDADGLPIGQNKNQIGRARREVSA